MKRAGFTPHLCKTATLWRFLLSALSFQTNHYLQTLTPFYEKRCKKRCLAKVSGFTIVELLVAMSLFLVLTALATGTFVQTLRTQRIVTELSAANNNTTQNIEQIAREIRTGLNFVDSTDNILKFVNYRNEQVSYKLINHSVARCVGNCESDDKFKSTTAPEVKVERLKFIISGKELTDEFPTRVTIILTVLGPKDIRINLQTTVSSRILESKLQ